MWEFAKKGWIKLLIYWIILNYEIRSETSNFGLEIWAEWAFGCRFETCLRAQLHIAIIFNNLLS